MAQFNPANYATVDERIAEFYVSFPEGSIRTRMASDNGPRVVFEARIYRSRDDAIQGVYTSGWAHEVEGSGPVNKTNHIENAETSAVGRALANLGFSGSINGKRAPRPSREEMEQAERRAQSAASAPKPPDERHVLYIRTVGPKAPEDAQIRTNGKDANLREWTNKHWSKIKAEAVYALAAVRAIEAATGVPFDSPWDEAEMST